VENQIKSALFKMEKNKAVGSDGFPIEFYQRCWSFIKEDMIEIFSNFHKGCLDIERINLA
jgi:hypothetical protein